MTLFRYLWRSGRYVTQSSSTIIVSNGRCSSDVKILHNPSPVPCCGGRLLSPHPHFLKDLQLPRYISRVSTTEEDSEKYGYLGINDQGSIVDHNECVQDEVQQSEVSLLENIKWHRVSQSNEKRTRPVGEAVIRELINVLGMTREEALATVFSRKFFLVADAAVIKTIYCLKDFDMSPHQIQRSPWILLQSAGEVAVKLNMVTSKYLFHNHYDGMGFCRFSKSKIRKVQKFFEAEGENFPDHNNRLYYMSDKLKIPVDELTEKVVKISRLIFYDFKRIESFMDMFNKYDIHHEDILNDLWIFFNNTTLADKRLQEIINAGCKRPKLWMCRCTEEIFERSIKKYQLQKNALGDCTSSKEYLMKRLKCTSEEITYRSEFKNSLKSVSVAKMERIIDLLISEGFTTEEILSSLRILHYSEDRTAERIRILKALGFKNFRIALLYKSPMAFEKYCNIVHVKKINTFKL